MGLLIAGVSFFLLNNKYVEPVPMKDIVITARDIPMYEIIRSQDLKTIQVPVATNTEGFFITATDIIGKIPKIPLAANDLIHESALLNKKEIDDVSFVTINTTYTKTGGAKPGDIVDVYKVNLEKGDWVENNQATLVAENVVVVSLTTANGKSIDKGTRMPLGGSEKIEAIKLGVKPDSIESLVPASVTVENGYVLVVKNSIKIDRIEKDKQIEDILEKETIEGGEAEDAKNLQEKETGADSKPADTGKN